MAKQKSKGNTGKAVAPKSSMKMQPLGDRVLVRETKEDGEKIVSGIILPSTGEDRGAKKGEVIAVGPGKYDDGELVPMQVTVGDKVLFQWGDKLTIDGEEYEMVAESAVLAVIK